MHLLAKILFVVLILTGPVVYVMGGLEMFDKITMGVLTGGGVILLYWIFLFTKPVISVLKERDTDDDNAEEWQEGRIPETIEELKTVAAARIENGESADYVVDDLCRTGDVLRCYTEPIVLEIFNARQRRYRRTGLLLIAVAGILLLTSLVFQDTMIELLSGVNRWSAHQTGRFVHWTKLSLWALALCISIKGLAHFIFGGKGIQTKRPF